MKTNQYNQNDKKHGLWQDYYYNNGQLAYKGDYNNGKKHGFWECYWSNGNLLFKGDYINGNRIGYWVIDNNVIKFFLR